MELLQLRVLGGDAVSRGDNDELKPQFINLTDSISMDGSARTKVRVQVMRQYHKNRLEKEGRDHLAKTTVGPPKLPLTAKSQTHKFRLDQGTPLKPWVAVKSRARKDQKPPERGTMTGEERGTVMVPRCRTSPVSSAMNSSVEPTASLYNSSEDTHNNQTLLDNNTLDSVPFYQSPASGILDPFSTMSLQITPRMQMLIHHYFSERLQSSWLMMPMRKCLFSLAMQDEALFHTVMPHYVARYSARFQTGDSQESLWHRNQAIRIVNERLRDPSHALTDGTIATVANLVNYESSNGSLTSVSVHVNGLVDLVNMRGGIESGGFSPFIKRLIGWTDWHGANALSTELRMPPLDLLGARVPNTNYVQSSFGTTENDPASFDVFRILGDLTQEDKLETTLRELRNLAATMQALHANPVQPQEDIWYSDKLYHLQRSLYDIVQQPQEDSRPLDTVTAIVALIYCAHCLRDVHLSFGVITSAVARLKPAIETVQSLITFGMDTQLLRRLFWVLGLGGTAAEGKPERQWFVAEFRSVSLALQSSEEDAWDTAKSIWESILWHECLDEPGRIFLAEALPESFTYWR